MIRLLRVRPADLLPGDWVWDRHFEFGPDGFRTGKILLAMHCVGEVLRTLPSGSAKVRLAASSWRGTATIHGHIDIGGTVRVMRLEESHA